MISSAPWDVDRPVAVSCAGGQSRQFRVQYRADYHDGWQRYECFRDESAALDCAGALKHRGYQARVVRYRITPVAA